MKSNQSCDELSKGRSSHFQYRGATLHIHVVLTLCEHLIFATLYKDTKELENQMMEKSLDDGK